MVCPYRPKLFGVFRRNHLFQAIGAPPFGDPLWRLRRVDFACAFCGARESETMSEAEAVSRGIPVSRHED